MSSVTEIHLFCHIFIRKSRTIVFYTVNEYSITYSMGYYHFIIYHYYTKKILCNHKLEALLLVRPQETSPDPQLPYVAYVKGPLM